MQLPPFSPLTTPPTQKIKKNKLIKLDFKIYEKIYLF